MCRPDSSEISEWTPICTALTNKDICCGRGRGCYGMPGNYKLRALAESYGKRYKDATTKKEKSLLVDAVLSIMLDEGARYVKKVADVWYDIGVKAAREKTAHAFRDELRKRPKKKSPMKIPPADWSNFHGSNSNTARRAFSEPSSSLSQTIQNFNETFAEQDHCTTLRRSKSSSDLSTNGSLCGSIQIDASVSFSQEPLSAVGSINYLGISIDHVDAAANKNLLQPLCGGKMFRETYKGVGGPCSLLDPATEGIENAPDFC